MKNTTEVVYLLSSLTGALLIALNVGMQFEGYLVFLLSSILGAYLVIISNASRSLFAVHLMYAVVNIIGIVRA